MDFNERLYTVAEVAEILRVSRPTVYRMIKQKRIPTIRVGESWRISSVRLKDWMDTSVTAGWPKNDNNKKR
jgi:excisionase family DNA binding protein